MPAIHDVVIRQLTTHCNLRRRFIVFSLIDLGMGHAFITSKPLLLRFLAEETAACCDGNGYSFGHRYW